MQKQTGLIFPFYFSALAEGELKEKLEAQAQALSLKFDFVTPLTSMVVTKPDAQDVANKPTEAGKSAENMEHQMWKYQMCNKSLPSPLSSESN